MTSNVAPAISLLPYGEQQGSFRGVVACSNRDDGYFSGENNYVNSTIYTGYRYQCVEYGRRFLLLTTGCIFANCGRASEIYAMKHITHVETGEKYALHHHNNDGTAKRKPAPGDIIIYPFHPELTPWGHIGIISYVDDTRVGIAEQNQFFGPFTSPSDSYLDGERCVARYSTLKYDEAKETWTIEEPSTMPQSFGWMSYPDAPTREHIYAPLTPLPSVIQVRSTPFDHEDHPFLSHFHLHNGLDIPSGRVAHAYGMHGGSSATLVGAGSAISRVLRFTMQLLFHRSRLGSAFRALPTNPLDATLPTGAETCRELDDFLAVLGDPDVVEAADATPDALRQAIAEYFDVPLKVVLAMERDFAKAESHLAAAVTFYPNFATGTADIETFHAARQKLSGAATGGPTVDGVAATASPTTANTSTPTTEEPCVGTAPGTVEEMPFNNQHDEAWCVARVNFGSARVMTEVVQLNEVKAEVIQAISMMTPSPMRCFLSIQYRVDLGNYLKSVETIYGPRTALTIVLSDDQPMDGLLRELVAILQGACERIKYPVRVVDERDLVFIDGKLRATPSAASPEAGSPTTSITPAGAYEVNFVFSLCEWPRILANSGANHMALYQAAVDPAADVVFAKPLWSHLCSGNVNVSDAAVNEPHSHQLRSRSVRFFDLCRRLYLLASPKQPPETWDIEVSEFKDSCRRIGIAAPVVPTNPPGHLRAECVVINLAGSCIMAHVGGKLHPDPENTGAHDGHPAALGFVFPAD